MSAIAVPVQVDDNLIEISSSYSTVRLNQILRHLAHNASVNARVVVTLQHQLEDMRLTMERQTEHTKQQFALEARRRLDLEEALNVERKKLDDLDRTASRKADVDQTFKNFGDKLKMATDFIAEIENGKGERVTKFVSNYIQQYIPEWWGGVSAELMAGIHKLVRETAQTAATNLEKRAAECEKKAVFGDQQVQTSCTNSLYGLDGERRKDISKLRDEMYGRFTNSDHRTDALIETQRAIGEKRYVLTRRRLQTLEESAAALRTTLCLEDELCRELHNITISQENMRDDSDGDLFATTSSRSELGVAPKRDVVTDIEGDDDLPGAQRMPDTAEHFKRMSIDETIQDIRVRRVAQTPHLLNMRTLLQREFNDRMEYQKADLHNDLVAEIFDLQREIRGKVGTNKLGELLDQYRDENLYTNVKLLMQDMTDVKTNKIDSVLFVEALRSKADLRQVELKVDKSILHQQLEVLDRRVDDMTSAVGRHDHRLGRVEHNYQQLLQKKGSVSPTQALYDAPSMMMIEDGGFRQGGSARNGAQRGTSSPQAKGMRNRGAGGSAPNGRVSPPVMVSSPTRRDSSTSSAFTIPTTKSSKGSSASKHQTSQQQVASLVDQIVERGFASQIIVQDQREMSKLHQTIVKQTHERQVQEMLDESAAAQQDITQVDPDVEVLPALPDAAVRKASHSAQSSSSATMGRTVSAASARGMSSQAPRQQTVGGSARLNRNASGLVRSSSRNSGKDDVAEGPGLAAATNQGPGLIPLTSSQEAYCKTLDTQPPPNSGRGISIGLRVGEKRDW